jgi:2-polyprenyl-3-methyl-5-hydroxy-6-metoxy-1,4-benzoquinol methylase
MDRKEHWNSSYSSKEPNSWSWYQESPETSIDLIKASGVAATGNIIDVGGGASTLTQALLKENFSAISVLDISSVALEANRKNLGLDGDRITWIESDITSFSTSDRYDLWHDRAVFHFLTDPADQEKYRQVLYKHLKPGGHLIVSTFALDGPKKCSGLDIQQNDAESLHKALGGDRLVLKESREEQHQTPSGKSQKFIYCRFICL